ncbi:MAG TPA: IS66 family insertion sequence element accessory protein TnpB [Polyangiaceae bacterium]|nr:IS66 family insertion sequence element accessory protein TnpB [Polyangiaceae bacterium]
MLSYKRLERGRFRLPHVSDKARTVEMDSTELGMLLDGIDVRRVRRPPKWEPRRAEGAPASSSG